MEQNSCAPSRVQQRDKRPEAGLFFLATFSFETIVMQWVMTRTHEESLVATLVHRPGSGRVHWQCLWAQSPPPARSRCYGFSLFPRTRREETSERPHRPSGGSLADARDPGRREKDLSSQIGAFRQTISVYFYAERSRTTTSFSSTDEAQCPSVSDL